jgi:DNA-binding HxlR family transcriptional regulator
MRTQFDRWSCPTQRTVEQIGDKWTLFLIREFIFGKPVMGFNELLRTLSPISSRTLALKLKKLQEQGILTRKVLQETPMKVEYRITKKGLALKKALVALGDWQKGELMR